MGGLARASSAIVLTLGVALPVFSENLSLEQVIKEVCTNSDSIQMMKENVKKSQQVVRENKSAVFPTIGATVTAGRARAVGLAAPILPSPDMSNMTEMIESFSVPGEANIFNASLQLSQSILTFGKIGNAIGVAKRYENAAHQSFGRGAQQLQLSAVDGFSRVVLAQMALAVTNRSLARKRELYEFLDRNFKMGSGNRAQLLAAQAELQGQQPEIITAEQNVRGAKMMLATLMGRPDLDSVVLDTATVLPDLLSAPMPSKDEAAMAARTNRGDLRHLESMEQAIRGGVKISRSMYFPSIGLNGTFGIGGTENDSTIFDYDKVTWSIGVGLQWTFFDGFKNAAKMRQYESDAHKLELSRKMLTQLVDVEIETDLSECAAADSNLVAMRGKLAAARESYDLYNENFKQGMGQFAELQQAEERLSQAEMGAVDARYRVIRSRAALRVAMGSEIVKVEGL